MCARVYIFARGNDDGRSGGSYVAGGSISVDEDEGVRIPAGGLACDTVVAACIGKIIFVRACVRVCVYMSKGVCWC